MQGYVGAVLVGVTLFAGRQLPGDRFRATCHRRILKLRRRHDRTLEQGFKLKFRQSNGCDTLGNGR